MVFEVHGTASPVSTHQCLSTSHGVNIFRPVCICVQCTYISRTYAIVMTGKRCKLGRVVRSWLQGIPVDRDFSD